MLQALLRIWPLTRPSLAATLAGVSGFTGRGAVRYLDKRTGVKILAIRLDGLAGREASIVTNTAHPLHIKIENGHANRKFVSKDGHKVPALCEGDRIDVHQNGEVILSGVLTRN